MLVAPVLAVWLVAHTSLGQDPQGVDATIDRLGPGPFLAGFESLDALVRQADAVVVATVVSPGRLSFEEFPSANGLHRNVMASGVYGVSISDVLRAAPTGTLKPGVRVDVQLRVGREAARAIRAGRDLVSPGDECLLFLFQDRGGWSLIGWHLQFRRAAEDSSSAEVIGSRSPMPLGSWFGTPVNGGTGVKERVSWSSLIALVAERGRAHER